MHAGSKVSVLLLLLGPLAVAGAAGALDGDGALDRPTPARILALALGAGVLLTGIGVTVAMLREQSPGPSRRAVREPPDSSPEALGAPLTAAVRCGDARAIHAVACLFDLAARGCVQFELADPDRPRSTSSWSVRRLRAAGEPAPWERVVLEAVSSRPGEAAPAAAAWRALHRRSADFRAVLRDALRARGDVDPQAGERRRPFHVLAIAAALLAAGGFAVAAGLAASVGAAAFAPAVACAVVTPIALAAASAVPRHTRRGAERARAVQAFRRSLRTLAGRRSCLDAQHFERWFAHAVALGLATEWMRAAKRAKLAPPAWFGGSRSALVPLPALEAQLLAAGAIESRGSAPSGAVG